MFLLDTGSEISLIKKSSLSMINQAKQDTKQVVVIKGITGNRASTLGIVEDNVVLTNGRKVSHRFHVIDDNFPFSNCDGLLGKDFLNKHNLIIDYNKKVLTFPINDRLRELVSQLSFDSDASEIEKAQLMQICEEFNDVFHLEGESLSTTELLTHHIPIYTDTAPINVRPYRLAETHKSEINRQIQNLLSQEIIIPSKSAWNAPLLIINKKDDAFGNKQWRLVIDYRKLNEVTIGDAFPIPNITEILDSLGASKYFTSLDLADGYYQIKMSEEDREKTAFSTNFGHFEFNRMSMGLKGAPATFQRLMNIALSGLIGQVCLVYLDDIIVFGDNVETHNENLKTVLKKLREHNLKLKPSKCHFLRKELKFLGHIVTENGIKPDPSKIEAVKNFPRPKDVKTVQTFLGLANYYRRFIPNFSKIAQPINNLLKKKVKFLWDDKCEVSFTILKECLTTSPVLSYPDFRKEFILTTDASTTALGAVLSQGEIGKDLPVAYGSRTLNSAERNYSTIERELLAIVWATHTFRPYLLGRKFTVVTDHRPLLWLFSVKDPSSRLVRWKIKLAEYNFNVVFKPGKYNSNADALSRIQDFECAVITRAQTQILLKNNENDKYKYTSANEQNIITLTEDKEIKRVLNEFHNTPLGGHQGFIRTYNRIKSHYVWQNMKTDIAEMVKNCELCQTNKISLTTKMPMKITTTSSKPFEKMFLDIVGPLCSSYNNNKYILTIQDDLTKFSMAIPIPDMEAKTVAENFVTRIICTYGTPDVILTDQGTNFLSDLFKNICKYLKIKKIQTSGYHPQTNGALERSHRTLSEYLRNFSSKDPLAWDAWLPYAMFTYNTTPHTSTKYTPYELLYGFKASLPSSIQKSPEPCYNYDDYLNELRVRLQTTHKLARDNLIKSKEKSKGVYDNKVNPIILQEGDKVFVKNEKRVSKFSPIWLGPYDVVKPISRENTAVKIKHKPKVIHNNRLKLCKNK